MVWGLAAAGHSRNKFQTPDIELLGAKEKLPSIIQEHVSVELELQTNLRQSFHNHRFSLKCESANRPGQGPVVDPWL